MNKENKFLCSFCGRIFDKVISMTNHRRWHNNFKPQTEEEINKKEHEWYIKNRDRILEERKEYRVLNKDKINRWFKKNQKRRNEYNKNYLTNHPGKKREYDKKYNEKHREEISIKKKIKWQKIRDVQIPKNSLYQLKRRKIDKNFNMLHRLRSRLYFILKVYTKTGKIMPSKKYGIDYQAIINYLKPFPEDISKYQVHHKKALFTFNFVKEDDSTNLEEIKKAFAPENHQWITIEEHRKLNHKGGGKLK